MPRPKQKPRRPAEDGSRPLGKGFVRSLGRRPAGRPFKEKPSRPAEDGNRPLGKRFVRCLGRRPTGRPLSKMEKRGIPR